MQLKVRVFKDSNDNKGFKNNNQKMLKKKKTDLRRKINKSNIYNKNRINKGYCKTSKMTRAK